jgi:hypothetical protein
MCKWVKRERQIANRHVEDQLALNTLSFVFQMLQVDADRDGAVN